MTPHTNGSALLMVAASEKSPNLYYATKFLAPDAFYFFQIRGKKILLMSDLELDRAKDQADVDEVISVTKLVEEIKKKTGKSPGGMELLEYFLRKNKVDSVLVPGDFPIEYADPLRARGFKVAYKSEPFFEDRVYKSKDEISKIDQSLRHTETAVDAAVTLLRKSKIVKDKIIYEGEPVTSELLKKVVNVTLMEHNMVGEHTIISNGKDCVDPHNEGSGLIRPHQSIIMDVFPRSADTRYYADFTRTFVKGKASPKLKKMYKAVEYGQEIAFARIRDGAEASDIHNAINDHFEKEGFKTGFLNGRMQGFFHGTGHGLGLEVHEPPRISKAKHILKTGEVVTVEPGLYYLDAGGVRLEDLVVVREKGMTNLTQYPRFLEIE